MDLIVDVAERAEAHAVWVGWGHAFENPRLPEGLAASKHKTGPPGSLMRSLGDKTFNTIVDQNAEVGLKKAEQINWPVMNKASEGGGGKGIIIGPIRLSI